MRSIAIVSCALALAGCIDGFRGSNVQLDLGPGTPVQAPVGAAPAANEIPANSHFTLYAFEGDAKVGRLFALQTFEIHHIVDLTSPCFIDVGANVPHPGLHVSQYAKMIEQDTGIPDPTKPPAGASAAAETEAATALQRQMNVALLAGAGGLDVVSSASTATYPAVAADCSGGPGIPPPMCTDAASNQRRLAACEAAWHAAPDYFEGTDRVLTAPLSGTTHGMVDGSNPINLAPVGGAQFFVDSELAGFDGYAIYWQQDGMPDPGNLLLFGTATTPSRDVMHVHMTSPGTPGLTAELAIFANVDQDSVHF